MNNGIGRPPKYDTERYTATTTAARAHEQHGMALAEKKRRLRILSSVWIAFVSCVAAAVAAVFIIFSIKDVTVTGNSLYDADSLISGAGISRWSSYFFVNEKNAAKALSENYPAVREVKLVKTPPSSIEMTVTESEPALFINIGSFTYILDDKLVVHRTSNAEEAEALDLKHIFLSGVSSCIAGQYIETEDEDIPEMFSTLYGLLEKYELLDSVSSIHFDDKFDVSFTLGSEYTIKIGTILECEAKISYVKQFLPQIMNLTFYTVDITDENVQKIIISKR